MESGRTSRHGDELMLLLLRKYSAEISAFSAGSPYLLPPNLHEVSRKTTTNGSQQRSSNALERGRKSLL